MDSPSGEEVTLAPDNKPPPPPSATGLVDLYLEYSKDLPTPRVFRLWSAIHAVGAAAERRMWTNFGRNKLYPNLFVFLVGPPGVGKTQALEPMAELLRKSGAVTMAPNDISKQGLLDALANAAKGALLDGRPFDYHFLALSIRELANFMSKYDMELTGLLTDLFDCPSVNEEVKRTHDKGKLIPSPGISFIMGTATQNLGSTISTEMWGSGFMARVIMVYSADEIIPEDMFEAIATDDRVAEELVVGLRRIGEMKGHMTWDPEAQKLLHHFRVNQKTGAPIHNRLTHYVTRRWLHLGKLCMIAALSDERQHVDAEDFRTALSWLHAAEHEMPEIFKDMVSHEDGQIHEELRNYCMNLYMKAGRIPIHASVVYKFLAARVASHTISRIIEVTVAADYLRRCAGTEGDDAEYVPQGNVALSPGVM